MQDLPMRNKPGPLHGIIVAGMPSRLFHIPMVHALVTILVVATAVGAPMGQAINGIGSCANCPQHDLAVPPGDEARSCCHPGAAGEHAQSAQPENDQPAKHQCPACGHCCAPQGRAPAVFVSFVTFDLPAAVGSGLAVPPVLPPPAGVDRSVFHPPKA